MKITFLGTGGVHSLPQWGCDCKTCVSADPKNTRFRPVLLVEINDKSIAIDFGNDFSHQLKKFGVKKLDYIFLTHAHGDHYRGSEVLGIVKNCTFIAHKDVMQVLEQRVGMDWVRKRNPSLVIKEFEPMTVEGVTIDAVKLEHQKDFQKDPCPCYGFVFRGKDFSFAYCTDYNRILEPEKLQSLDLLISGACGWKDFGVGHVGVEGAVEVYKQLKPKKMILTHINHYTEHNEVAEFVKQFGDIEVAFDGLVICKE